MVRNLQTFGHETNSPILEMSGTIGHETTGHSERGALLNESSLTSVLGKQKTHL